MSITTYFEKKDDGTIIVREIEEKMTEYHPGALDTAIEHEKDKDKLSILKQAKEVREDKKIKKIDSLSLVTQHKEALAGKAVK